MNAPTNTSDDPAALEVKRRQREEERAYWRALNQHQQLRALGREGSTSYGHDLFQNYAETVAVSIDALLSKLIADPHSAGKHHSAWVFLLHFCNRGPRSIAAVTLGVIVDNITRRLTKKVLAYRIGKALLAEFKAIRLHQAKGHTMLRQLRKKLGKTAVRPAVLRQLKVGYQQWTVTECREIGLLLLELIATNTTLIQFQGEVVAPTECVQELVDLAPPRPLPARRLPCLVKPSPWTGPQRDSKALVTSRRPIAMDHITEASLKPVLRVVNYVEAQALTVDSWMARAQREAWEADLPLFPVSREPANPFEPKENVTKRVRVEETLRQCEEVDGMAIWLEHDLDFRGRIYAGARFAGHQGPDHQKALLQFKQLDPIDDQAFQWMLIAAATHYGISSNWRVREAWATERIRMMQAIAAAPLDRVDEWKQAKDPWQFLQMAKAIADHLSDRRRGSGVPIRMDQTCSGLGHIGALLRDHELCQATNVIGVERQDVYALVAGDIRNLLQVDLHSFDFAASRQAEFWLMGDINRSLAKGPVMTSVYGAKTYGLIDQLVGYLQERNPNVRVGDWEDEYVRPAAYMAKKFAGVIKDRLASSLRLEAWLREVSNTCMRAGQRIRYDSPSGFPIQLGSEVELRQRVATDLHGNKAWQFAEADHKKGQLSARATNRGITANVVHSIDAAFCHLVVSRCANVAAPVLTNHDCFATTPANATFLHATLLNELRELHKAEWLENIRQEVSGNAGVKLPRPPVKGNVCPGVMGENSYVFS